MGMISTLQSFFGAEPFPSNAKNETESGNSGRRENELQKKNRMLSEQLRTANEHIARLEEQMTAMKKEKDTVDQQMKQLEEKTDRQVRQLAEGMQKQIDALKGTADQIQAIAECVQSVGAIRESTDQIGAIRESTDQIGVIRESADQIGAIRESTDKIDGISASVRQMDEKLKQQGVSSEELEEMRERLRADLAEKIHAENVLCYRNIKGLATDLDVKISELELDEGSLIKIQKSFKGLKFFSFCGFLGFLLLIFVTLYLLGVMPF